MRAKARDYDRKEDHDACDDRCLAIACTIQQSERVSSILAQKNLKREHRDRRSSQRSEEEAPTHQAGPLIIVVSKFWPQSRARHFIQTEEESKTHQRHDQINKQMTLRPF